MGRKYYMVRAMQSNELDFQLFFEQNVVAVGWSRVDFSSYGTAETLKKAVQQEYYEQLDLATQVISKKMNEIERFKTMKKGDYVIVPYYSSIVIAEVEEKEIYCPNALDRDLANQRAVTYRYVDGKPLMIPRNELSEGFQRRLRVRGSTVANLYEFKDEIDKIFSQRSYSYSHEMQALEKAEYEKFRKTLLENIQQGKTYLQTGGIGLEKLVCEMMQCEGYDATVLAKTTFSGQADADILAIKEDSFSSQKIFVQVKHHNGYSGQSGIQQLIDVLQLDEYQEYRGYFITSGLIADDIRQFAINHQIEVMDGYDLIELIIHNLDQLTETTKRLLGISMIPRVIV